MQQIEVRLVAITIEFDSTLAYTPFHFSRKLPLMNKKFKLDMHKTLLIYNTVTFYIFGDVVTLDKCTFRDEVAKKKLSFNHYFLTILVMNASVLYCKALRLSTFRLFSSRLLMFSLNCLASVKFQKLAVH